MAGSIENTKAILRLAAPRGGVCTRAELLAAGVGRGAIDGRVKLGFLTPIRRGVYVCNALRNSSTPLHAAVMSVPASIVSHLTAAIVNEFPVEPPPLGSPVHLIAANGSNRRLSHVIVHRLRRLPTAEDVVTVDGVPVTAPARTIVDLASIVGPARLRYVIQTQARAGSPSLGELVACFDSVARRGVNGICNLRRVLSLMLDDSPIYDSALEAALAEIMNRAGITGFVPQYRPLWYDGRAGVVDFAHPELRLVLEADGRSWHAREQDMTTDRRRDRLALKHGWITVRVTWGEVTKRPAATAGDLVDILHRRAAELAA